MSYGIVAVNAATLTIKSKISPVDAWQKSVCKAYPDSKESQLKGCPKNTFLGLCSEGQVKNIPKGNYTKSELNRWYAKNAVAILKTNKSTIFTPLELWRATLLASGADIKKVHNSQMNVVLALWEEGMIV